MSNTSGAGSHSEPSGSAAQPISFSCSQCSTTLTATRAQAGTSILCSTCSTLVRVPQVSDAPAPVQAAASQPAGYDLSRTAPLTEAPAPVMGAKVENIAAPKLEQIELSPLPSAPVAVVAQSTTESVRPASAEGMRIESDPNAGQRVSGSALAYNAAASASAYRPQDQSYAQPAKRSTGPVTAVAAFAVLAVAGVIGVNVRNGMERTRIETEVQSVINDAELAFKANDVEKALMLVNDADARIKSSAYELDAQKRSAWIARMQVVRDVKAELDQLDGIFANAEKDLAGTRSKLENKKGLYGAVTAENQPLHTKAEALLGQIAELELQRKREKLAAAVKAANSLYLDGKIEEAAARAVEIASAMNEKPQVQEPELEKRLTTLKKRAADLNDARKERMQARSENYPEIKRKLKARIDSLDEKNADLKPLVVRLTALHKEVVQEEKRSRKLQPDEVTEIKTVLHELNRRDKSILIGTLEGDSIGFTFDGKEMRMGFQRALLGKSLFVEVAGHRFGIELDALFGREASEGQSAKPARSRRVLTHALALADAMNKAAIPPDEFWSAVEEAPLVSARRTDDEGRELIFLGDRLYVGKLMDKTLDDRAIEADFEKKAEALAKAVENDKDSSEDVRRVVVVALRAAFKDADWHDHLPGKFVRQVIAEGYVEKNLPGIEKRLAAELKEYREAYGKISNPHLRFTGASTDGDEAFEYTTFEDHAIWRLYNKKTNQTTFAIKNPDDEKDCLFILYDFPGKLSEFPLDAKPVAVRMTHQAIGVTASYDPATEKVSFERETWDKAATLEAPLLSDEIRTTRGYGAPAWSLPPHVLLVDPRGNCTSIVTPTGRLDIQDFNKIADPKQREAAMEKFLDQMAKVLPSAEYLHLYFRYFFEYTLDSPITSATSLLGSRAHSGDIHQTTYQSLERFMGGNYIGDCDDLAEFYVNVSRRQNKLSYVMALPQHAACGWAEKNPGEGSYTFYVIDTGPPRMFRHKELDEAIEMAFRAYDESKTARFDPKSLGFLFRFNGEPTRTPYYLSSRMYTDREYGETMERVQSYWHFHFYALGIEKMTDMIEKGDRVPENCVELAGLYGQVKETEKSIHWTTEAMKQLKPEDRSSRQSEQFRIAMMWREEHDNDKAYDALKPLISELKQLQGDAQSLNFLSMRLQVMGLLVQIERPWEAWDVVLRDMVFIARRGLLKIEHAGGLTSIYKEMQDQVRKGKQLNESEKQELTRLESLLKWFYENALFEQEDDFNDWMRKYAFVGTWYAGKYGQERLVSELLKGGPFPDPATPRKHDDRKDPEAQDWNWVRLSLHAYSMAIGDALDLDLPEEKWRKEEAVKLSDAMFKAATHAKKFGSLSSSEFALLSTRVFRAFLVKDWKDFEAVLKETQQRDWARLTTDIAETMGRCARFVTPEEFVEQYRLFLKYIKPRTTVFTVIYEAYRAEAMEHALQASKVALGLFPGDEDMKREARYLEELAKGKAAKKAKKAAAEAKPAQPAQQPAPQPQPTSVK